MGHKTLPVLAVGLGTEVLAWCNNVKNHQVIINPYQWIDQAQPEAWLAASSPGICWPPMLRMRCGGPSATRTRTLAKRADSRPFVPRRRASGCASKHCLCCDRFAVGDVSSTGTAATCYGRDEGHVTSIDPLMPRNTDAQFNPRSLRARSGHSRLSQHASEVYAAALTLSTSLVAISGSLRSVDPPEPALLPSEQNHLSNSLW